MSFGISVGDVLVCSKLAASAYNALRDAPKEFQDLSLEVLSLNQTLRALGEEASSPTSIILLASPQRQESLRVLLENCSKGLAQLELLVTKYQSIGSSTAKSRFLDHVRFASKEKQGPRDKLAIHTASISIFLTSLTHSSLGRLELLIKNALRPATGPLSLGSDNSTFQQAWNNLGRDLAYEGIEAKDIERFGPELHAYLRHLRYGGEPYWKTPPQRISAAPVRTGTAPPSYGAPLPRADSVPVQQQQSLPSRPYVPAQQAQPPASGAAPPQYTPSQVQGSQKPEPGSALPQQPARYDPDARSYQPAQQGQSPVAGVKPPQSPFSSAALSSNSASTSGTQEGQATGSAPSQPLSGGLFGNSKSEQQIGGLFGNTRSSASSGLFGSSAPVHTEPIDDLVDLFDHMFDVDEGIPILVDSPTVIPTTRYQSETRSPLPYPPSNAAHFASLGGNNAVSPYITDRAVNTGPSAPSTYTSSILALPPLPQSLNDPYRPSLIKEVTNQLLSTTRQAREAQQSGNSHTLTSLTTKELPERVQYLRTAGIGVIQCDICHIPVEDVHFHCDVCANSDWDICTVCVGEGTGCLGGHKLIKRYAKAWGGESYWTHFGETEGMKKNTLVPRFGLN